MPLECAQVRTFVTPVLLRRLGPLALVCAVPCFSQAEVVHMKNGDVIYADRVTETTNTLQYEIGDDSYTVPRSKVERVEIGTPSPVRHLDLPAYVPAGPVLGEGELLGQIVREGSVNREALNLIESAHKKLPQAAGYWPMESGPLNYTSSGWYVPTPIKSRQTSPPYQWSILTDHPWSRKCRSNSVRFPSRFTASGRS